MPVDITTARSHTEEAIKRLPLQFRKPNIEAFVRAICGPMDTLEQAFVDLITLRNIDDATGATLRLIAKLVGQPITDLDEETLRSLIRARTRANASDGLGEQVLIVTRLVLQDIVDSFSLRAVNYGGAAFGLRVEGGLVEWERARLLVESFLREMSGDGIRALLEFITYPAVTSTKDGGTEATFDSGAASVETIAGDGYLTFKPEGGVNSYRAIGLSIGNPGLTRDEIDYGIYFRNDGFGWSYLENGVQANSNILYAATDVFRIQRIGTVVTAWRNDVLIYTFAAPSTGPLLVDTSFFNLTAKIGDIRLYDAGKRKAITWQNVTNVSISPIDPPAYSKRFRFSDATVYEAAEARYPRSSNEVRAATGGYGIVWSVAWLMDALSGNLPAIFGSPTLTLSNANANMFPKYGCPGVLGYSDKSIEMIPGGANIFTGDTSLALSSTDDLAFIIPGEQLLAPLAARQLISKGDTAGGTNRWQLQITNVGTDKAFWAFTHTDGTTVSVNTTIPIGKPFILIPVLERATGKIRIGARSLDGTFESVSAEVTIPANAYGSTNNFILGANFGLDAADRLRLSAMYVAKGNGVATGMSANLTTILRNFCTWMNLPPYVVRAQATMTGKMVLEQLTPGAQGNGRTFELLVDQNSPHLDESNPSAVKYYFATGLGAAGAQNWQGIYDALTIVNGGSSIVRVRTQIANPATFLTPGDVGIATFAGGLTNTYVPDYGNGFEDSGDKYPASLAGLRSQLMAGSLIDVGSTTGITWYDCNETSGNLVPKFGSGPTLTAAGTPLFGIAGPRGGNDKMVAVDGNADQWTGGDVYNVSSTGELVIMLAGRFTKIPSVNEFIAVKGNAGNPARWTLFYSTAGDVILQLVSASGTVSATVNVNSAAILGRMCVLKAVIDRSTQKARICIRTLDGTEVISTEVTTFAETLTNVDAFTLMNRSAAAAALSFQLAGFGITTGTNVAFGTSANLSAITSRFAAAMNRYYGGHLAAVME